MVRRGKNYRVSPVRLDRKKILASVDSPEYVRLVKESGQELIDIAIEVFDLSETEPGNRPSRWTPPIYRQSFDIRKVGRTWRIINTDPGATAVELGVHPGGGPTLAMRYFPIRRALDALGARARPGWR